MSTKMIPNTMNTSFKERVWPALKSFFQTPAGAGFWAVGLCCLFCFCLWEPVYLTNDDATMRGILSGTHFPDVGPSEFTLYMSTVLGIFIKTLYLSWPGTNCYEIFFYLVLSGSVWVIMYTLAKAVQQADYKYYLVVLLVLPCLLAVPFLGRQFTMVSALAAASGLVVFYSLFDVPLVSSTTWLVRGFYVVFALWLSSLVRFDAALTYGLMGGLYLLPLLPWRNAKKLLTLAIIGALALLSVIGTEYINQTMIKDNPSWQYRKDMNHYATSIFNGSIFAHPDGMEAAWHLVDKANISFTGKHDEFIWGKDYQQLLINFALVGELNVNNSSNMAEVSKMLAPQISNRKHKGLLPILAQPIDIDKISNHLWILLPVLLIFRNKKIWVLSLYFAACFFVVSVVISIYFRPLPYRLWYGYSILFFSILVFYIGTNYKAIQDNVISIPVPKYLKYYISMLLVIVLLSASYHLVYKQQRHGRMLLRFTNAIEADISKLSLDKDLIYLIDGSTFYLGTAPLRFDPWPKAAAKRIIFTTTIFSPENHEVLQGYNIPLQNTIENICRRADVRFLFAPKSWWGTFFNSAYSPFMNMANFVRERNDFEIGAVDVTTVDTDELAVLRVSPLDPQEHQLRREIITLQRGNSRIKSMESTSMLIDTAVDSYKTHFAGELTELAISLEKVYSFIK